MSFIFRLALPLSVCFFSVSVKSSDAPLKKPAVPENHLSYDLEEVREEFEPSKGPYCTITDKSWKDYPKGDGGYEDYFKALYEWDSQRGFQRYKELTRQKS